MDAFDILLNDDQTPLFANGDFVIGESDTRHIQHLLMAEKGAYKRTPLVGVSLSLAINAPNNAYFMQALYQRIQLQMQYDGYERIDFSLGTTTEGIAVDVKPTTTRKNFQ